MTQEEIEKAERLARESLMDNNGCGTQFATYLIIGMIFFLFASCTTKKSVEMDFQYRHISELTERMDSLVHTTATWQKSVYEKQTALVDSFKSREVRDTSRTYFLGAKGDTIKETVIIRETVEREHSSQESTQEIREEFFKQTDSLFSSNKILQAKVDSLLHDHNKTTVVEKKAPWYERLLNKIYPLLVIVSLLYIVFLQLSRKKRG